MDFMYPIKVSTFLLKCGTEDLRNFFGGGGIFSCLYKKMPSITCSGHSLWLNFSGKKYI
jgi:hypothetical protein